MKCPHFSDLIFVQAQKYGEKKAIWHQDKTDTWKAITWNQFAHKVKCLSKSLYDLGIRNQDRVAIYSNNKPESFITDFACFGLRAITVPMYATSSMEQVEYIINDAQISIIFVGNQEQYENAYELMENSSYLKNIIIYDDTVITHGEKSSHFYRQILGLGEKSSSHFEVEDCQTRAANEQIACILYTSGTSGEPKGVILTHENFLEAIRIHEIRLTSITDKDKSLAFLPINHVFERTWCYFCFFKGVEIFINEFPQRIRETIKEVQPTTMCSVPRFWEKVYLGVQATLDTYSAPMRFIVNSSIAIGRKYNLDYLRLKRRVPIHIKLMYYFADKFIFSKLKKQVGITHGNIFPTAGAALADNITAFFKSMGIPIIYGYGLTESTATISCYEYSGYVLGTVGNIMPDIEVKIGKDNEILVKGKTISPGYYNRPELNATIFTEDGFFKTGDAGKITNNNIILTERLKDLFKTSNGKYIAPQQIETRLTADKYIEEAAVIADGRNFVSAIIHPNLELIKRYAKQNNLEYRNINELLVNENIHRYMETRIEDCLNGMANFEKIKRFTLINKGFSLENGELTNTLKMRRGIIMEHYKEKIDLMYQE